MTRLVPASRSCDPYDGTRHHPEGRPPQPRAYRAPTWYWVGILASSVWMGCAVQDPEDGTDTAATDSAEETAPEFDFAAFDAEVEAALDEAGLEGATVAVVHRDLGMVHERAYGAWALDRRSYIASASKVVSAGVLAHLADQGLVDLDAPIRDALDGWGDRDPNPTVAQLLSNSSGMSGLLDNPAFPPYLCMFSDSTTLDDCGREIYSANDALVTVEPDTEYRYGGAPWQLAGAIAEHVSGTPWNTLVDEIYVQPCELEGLEYGNPYAGFVTEVVSGRSLSYPADGLPLEPSDNPNIEGGAYITASDYGRLLLMHLRGGMCPGGRVLEETTAARMREDRIATWGGTASLGPVDYGYEGYGLGWWLDRDVPGMASDAGIWGTTPWLDEERRYGAIILVEGSVDFGATVLERLVPEAAEAVDAAEVP